MQTFIISDIINANYIASKTANRDKFKMRDCLETWYVISLNKMLTKRFRGGTQTKLTTIGTGIKPVTSYSMEAKKWNLK